MIMGEARIMLEDPKAMDLVVAYLSVIEKYDIGSLRRMLHRDVELAHANYPQVRGRDIVVDIIEGYLKIIDGVEFEVKMVLGVERTLVIEKVNVATTRRMGLARVRVVTILEHDEDGLITTARIYGDTADLFRAFSMEQPKSSLTP